MEDQVVKKNKTEMVSKQNQSNLLSAYNGMGEQSISILNPSQSGLADITERTDEEGLLESIAFLQKLEPLPEESSEKSTQKLQGAPSISIKHKKKHILKTFLSQKDKLTHIMNMFKPGKKKPKKAGKKYGKKRPFLSDRAKRLEEINKKNKQKKM